MCGVGIMNTWQYNSAKDGGWHRKAGRYFHRMPIRMQPFGKSLTSSGFGLLADGSPIKVLSCFIFGSGSVPRINAPVTCDGNMTRTSQSTTLTIFHECVGHDVIKCALKEPMVTG